MSSILGSQKVILPFEEIAGARQISSIVTFDGETYTSYSLVDDADNYLGPVDIRKAEVPSDGIRDWLGGQEGKYEATAPARLDLIESSFFLNGKIETVIEGIDIVGRDGKRLKMRREGAAYPYGLVLEAVPA